MQTPAFISFLRENIIFIELVCAIVGIMNYKKFRGTFWQYFIYYLIIIFLLEAISHLFLEKGSMVKKNFFKFLVFPLQFIFFYWLYAINSLKSKKLFLTLSFIYLIVFLITNIFGLDKLSYVDATSYSTGILLLLILTILEFIKQIKSDDILLFKSSTMFYVNSGIAIYYLATLPLIALNEYLAENMPNLWMYYWGLQLVLLYLLNILYSAAFIWTKPN